MLRRICLWLTVLCLLMGLVPAALAEAPGLTSRSLLFEGDSYGTAVAALGEHLYLLMESGLYVLAPGDQSPQLLSAAIYARWVDGTPPPIQFLISGGGKLYGLSPEGARLYEVVLSQDSAELQPLADVKPFEDKYLRDSLCTDGQGLYALIEGEIQRFDIVSGQLSRTPAQDIQLFCLYEQGRYLALERLPGQGYQIVAIDAATGNREQLSPLTMGDYFSGMAYDQGANLLVIADRSSFYTWQAGEQPRYAAGYGQGDSYSLTLLEGGYAAILIDTPMLAIRPVSPAISTDRVQLMLADGFGRTEDYKAFIRDNPEIDLNFLPQGKETEEALFIRHMLTRDSSVDVYQLTDQNLLSAIRGKGYALNIAEGPVLNKFAQDMYPSFQAAFCQDDQLLAFPKQFFVSMLSYHEAGFEELGLRPPGTYDELLDLWIKWAQEHPEGHPSYMINPSYTYVTVESLIKAYGDWLHRNDMPLQFNTPAFQALLEKLLHVLQLYDDMPDGGGLVPLFYVRDVPVTAGYAYLSLSFSPGTKPAVGFSPDNFSYFVINPYTRQPQAARLLLAGYLQGLWPSKRMLVDSSINQPVLNPDYEEELAYYQERLERSTQQAQQAEGAEKREQEARAARAAQDLLRFEQEGRWLISQGDIDRYQLLVPNILISPFNPINELMVEYPQMFEALRQPDADVGRFLTELDSMCRLMLLERQQ